MSLIGRALVILGALVALVFGLATLVFAVFGGWSAFTHHPRAAMVTLPQYLMLLCAYGLAPCLVGFAMVWAGRRLRGS